MDISSYILSKFPGESPNPNGKLHVRCPFHDDRHPSFSIDLNRGGLFICGSSKCGVRGNFALFYKMMEGIVSWKDVYKALKEPKVSKNLDFLNPKRGKEIQKQGVIIDFPIEPFIRPIEDAEDVFYLYEREITTDLCDLFGIVYGRDGDFSGVNIRNSLVAPIFDLDGTYRTFQLRSLGAAERLRWKSPTGSPVKLLLYAGWLVSQGSGYLWIVEGASDVWNLWMNDVQAVGLFSKEASASQLNKIHFLCEGLGLTPVVCLDGDVVIQTRGGFNSAEKLGKELWAYGLNSEIFYLREEEDPGSLSGDRIAEIRCIVERSDDHGDRQRRSGSDSL